MTNIKMNNLCCVSFRFWFFLLVVAALARPIPPRDRSISHNSHGAPQLESTVKDLTMVPSRRIPHPASLAALESKANQHAHDHSHSMDPIPSSLFSRYPSTLNPDLDIALLADSNSGRPVSRKPTIPLTYPPPARSVFISPLPLLTLTCTILVVAYIVSYLRKRWHARGKGPVDLQGLELLPTSSVTPWSPATSTLPTSGLSTMPVARTVGIPWNPARRRGGRIGLGLSSNPGSGWRTGRSKSMGVYLSRSARLPVNPLARPMSRPQSTPILMLNPSHSSSLTPSSESELLIDLSTPKEQEREFQNPGQHIIYDSILGGSHVWAFDIRTGAESSAVGSTATSTFRSSSPDNPNASSPNTSVEASPASSPLPLCPEFKDTLKAEGGSQPVLISNTVSLPFSPSCNRSHLLPVFQDPVFVTTPPSPSAPVDALPLEFNSAAGSSSSRSTIPTIELTPRPTPTQATALAALPTSNQSDSGEDNVLGERVAQETPVGHEILGAVKSEVNEKDKEDCPLDPSLQPVAPHINFQQHNKLEFNQQEDLITLEDPDPWEIEFRMPPPELALTSEEQKPEPELELLELGSVKFQPETDVKIHPDPSTYETETEKADLDIKASQLSVRSDPDIDHSCEDDEGLTSDPENYGESQRKAFHEDFQDAIHTNTTLLLTTTPLIVASASRDHDHPDPELLPLPICSPSPVCTHTPAQTPTPPASPPPPSPSPSYRLLICDTNINAGPRPAWSLRASNAPALGLSANSLSPMSSTSSTSLHLRDKADVNEKCQEKDMSPSASPTILRTSLPESPTDTPSTPTSVVPSQSDSDSLLITPSRSTTPASTEPNTHRTRPRLTRSPLDIALAMQLRPGLGLGADPAWMVRFLMSMFGWFAILVGGSGDYL